eukprot:CAMPEP_0184690976 /NCGR_PEP_ID=MMETSP0312-20130426/31549_1 /TAXON_ID=31354 /ORGANISM="Compsopogon coeruleus, Strain SAG 36.94" /LENGTH=303 /DNA_ID=CAMNT_0027148581 /DNA_START=2090 /DNA_END=3001 /DNA_ORIENTATION=+
MTRLQQLGGYVPSGLIQFLAEGFEMLPLVIRPKWYHAAERERDWKGAEIQFVIEAVAYALANGWNAVGRNVRCVEFCAGQGAPSVVLAVLFPEWTITAMDMDMRNVRNLQRISRELELPNLRVVHGQVEDWERGPFEMVVGLNVCGLAADLVIAQALRFHALMVLIPCCISAIAPEQYYDQLITPRGRKIVPKHVYHRMVSHFSQLSGLRDPKEFRSQEYRNRQTLYSHRSLLSIVQDADSHSQYAETASLLVQHDRCLWILESTLPRPFLALHGSLVPGTSKSFIVAFPCGSISRDEVLGQT